MAQAVIPALRRLSQMDNRFLVYMAKPCVWSGRKISPIDSHVQTLGSWLVVLLGWYGTSKRPGLTAGSGSSLEGYHIALLLAPVSLLPGLLRCKHNGCPVLCTGPSPTEFDCISLNWATSFIVHCNIANPGQQSSPWAKSTCYASLMTWAWFWSPTWKEKTDSWELSFELCKCAVARTGPNSHSNNN